MFGTHGIKIPGRSKLSRILSFNSCGEQFLGSLLDLSLANSSYEMERASALRFGGDPRFQYMHIVTVSY